MKVQATKELLKLEYMKSIFKKNVVYNATAHFDGIEKMQFYVVGNIGLTTEEFNKYFKII